MAAAQSLPSTFEANGISIPAIGFGTFQGNAGNGQVKETVLKALRLGYRHIDTAAAYGNEEEVGQAIIESGIAREELFVTTKLAQTWHNPSDVEEALDQSLKALQLDYGKYKNYPRINNVPQQLSKTTSYPVDLYLMHFPHAYATGPNHSTLRQPDGKPVIDLELSRAYPQTWQAMEKLVDAGKTKLIGISNFNILKTKRILEVSRIRPAVNQVELHPYLPQQDLYKFCSKEGIHIMAHQPLGGRPIAAVNPNIHRPGPLVDPEIGAIAQSLAISPAQVILSWALQYGVSVIPKTIQENRMVENRTLFRLSNEHMRKISTISETKGTVRYLDPRNHVGFDMFNEDADEPIAVNI